MSTSQQPNQPNTILRRAVLANLRASGATRSSPLKFHGQASAAALWLYENDFAGMTSDGYYPLPPFGEVKRALDGALLVKLTIPQTRQTQVPSGISYTGFAYYYAAWCPERGWLSKTVWGCTALVGESTIKGVLADYEEHAFRCECCEKIATGASARVYVESCDEWCTFCEPCQKAAEGSQALADHGRSGAEG